jgi:gliding motility-associated-like protein
VAGNGTWAFQYAITATAPCVNAVSVITVEVGAGANAGSDSALTICGSYTAFDLFQALGGDPDTGGEWTAMAGAPGLLPGGLLDATLLPVGGQNAFVYTIQDPGCGTVQSTVLVTTVEYPDPGTATDLVVCATDAPFALDDHLGGTPDPGGVWSGPAGVFDGMLNPATHPGGTYRYTVEGNSYCADTSAVFTIVINQTPDAGLPAQVVLCDTLIAYPLLQALNGTPDPGGTWADLGGTGGLTGDLLNTTHMDVGVHEFLYTVAVQGCNSASAMLKVEVISNPIAVDVVATCNERDRTYVVTFTIEGGDPGSYMVVGDTGTITTTAPYVFTSAPVVVSRPFSVSLGDAFACSSVLVEATSPCDFDTEVFVPESFSPNGDGTNETFVIPGIEGYPGNTITIFNRWGAKLYSASGYDNKNVVWDGSSPNATLAGPAAAGTYFYVLDLGSGGEPLTGYIQLVR